MRKTLVQYADIIIAFFLFLILTFLYTHYINRLGYHADEYEWVGRSYYLNLVLTGDMDNLLWDSHFSYDHPKLTYFLFGAVLYPDFLVSGSHTYIDFLGKYNIYQIDYFRMPAWKEVQKEFDKINLGYMTLDNCDSSYCQSIPLIHKVRLLSVFFLVSAGILVYFIARLLSGIFISILITLYWSTHIVIVLWGLSATGEAVFLFFFNLGLFVLFLLLGSGKYSLLDMTILGSILSLGFSTKIHGVVLFMLSGGLIFFDLLKQRLTSRLKNIESIVKPLLWMSFIFCVVIVLINPYLWLNPISKTKKMIDHRMTSAQKQQVSFPQDALYNPQQRVIGIYENLYANSGDNSIIHIIRTRLLLFFTGIGIVALFKERTRNVISIYFLIFAFLITGFISWFLLLDWQRYYNILVLPYSVFIFKGISALFQYIPPTYLLLKKSIRTKMTI